MLGVALLALLVPALQFPTSPQFAGTSKLSSGFCFDFASWDITLDGHVDLLLPDIGSYGARLLEGDGQGGFNYTQFIDTGGMGFAEVGDFHQDGRLDLLGFESGIGSVKAVSLVKGLPGGFGHPQLFDTSSRSELAALGDLDGDGGLDAVVYCNEPVLIVDVLLNDGAGGLLTGQSLGVTTVESLALADVDLDGDLDAALSSQFDSDVRVLLGQGDGTLAAGPTSSTGMPAGWGLLNLHPGDLNEDGRADLVTVSGGVQLLVLGGAPGGLFGVLEALELGNLAFPVLVADLDEDGHQDVAFGRYPAAEMGIALGDGSGQLGPIVRTLVAGFPDVIGPCDADGDGHVDLVVIGRGTTQYLSFLPSPGNGVPLLGQNIDVPEFSRALAAADMDGDQITDLLSAGGTQLVVLAGDGGGGYAPATSVLLSAVADHVVTGDLQGDGLVDAVVLSEGAGSISTISNLGGALAPPQAIAPASEPLRLALGDCNGDGAPEILAGCKSPPGVSAWRNDGDGHFLGAPHLYPTQAQVLGIAAGDLTGDGLQDVVAVGGSPFTAEWTGVTVFRGDPGQLLTEISAEKLGAGAQHVGLGDADADGDLDVMTANYLGFMYLLTNLGQGEFADFVTADIEPDTVNALIVADLDGEGHAETLCRHSLGTAILGNGPGGEWLELGNIPTAFSTGQLVVFDADGDLDLDVAFRPIVAVTQPSTVVYLIRQLGPWFEVGPALAAPSGTPQLVGDGAPLAGHAVDFTLLHAPALAPAWLVAGISAVSLPFKDGVLVPAPDVLVGPFTTQADGKLELSSTWPAGVPSGVSLFLQAWMPPSAGDWSASQGLGAELP